MKKVFVHTGFCVFLFICYVISYTLLLQNKQMNDLQTVGTTGIWKLPPNVLSAIAGEFKGVLSDYLTLEAGAELGTELKRTRDGKLVEVKKNYDWRSIYRIFVASQVLDPVFAQTYIVAQGWLPWKPANMVDETQKILRTAIQHRPWDWDPMQALAFNTYYFLKDSGAAGKIFLEAAKKPDAPMFLSILGARLAQKGGETQTAIVLMKSMLEGKKPQSPDYKPISERLAALEGVAVLETAVQKYKAIHGESPATLNLLVDSGILARLPENPYPEGYCINARGEIFFDNPHCQ